MELTQIRCLECKSQEVKKHSSYETKNTFLEKLRKPISLMVTVVKAITEGMAFNAACRTFEIAKNTLISWQRRLANLNVVKFIFFSILITRKY